MRFIVDFYRYVILGGIGLSITFIVFVALQLLNNDVPFGLTSLWLGVAAFVLAIFVMSLGITATFISMHDRHADLVREVRALRETMTSRSHDA